MLYKKLVEVYEELDSTSKRLDKTYYISELLKETKDSDLPIISLLMLGRIYPSWDDTKIGVADRMVIKAIAKATTISAEKIENEWKKTGDLGLSAENLMGKKKGRDLADFGANSKSDLTISKVFESLKKLSGLVGMGSVENKQDILVDLLSAAKPNEAKYIVRTVLEQMRVGVGEGSLRDALVWAYFGKELHVKYDLDKHKLELDEEQRKKYNEYVSSVQEALDLTNDFAEVAKIAKDRGLSGLKKIKLKPGTPIKVMLFQKAAGIEDAFERVGKPAAFEFKYDGFRMQMHCKAGKVKLYTRRLEDVTSQFPDVVEVLEKHVKSKDYILDSEVIGFDPKTKRWLPFQHISQRIKRKYDIEELKKTVPVIINIFDAIHIGSDNLLSKPFKERRAAMKKVVDEKKNLIQLAEQLVTDDIAKAEKFYKHALDMGNEGVMAKNMEAPYKPGSRVGYGVKVKPVMETLDLAIVGAEWGTGKRSKWLSSFILACLDQDTREFIEIGKVGTGFKEKAEEEGLSFEELTNMLKPLITKEEGKIVKIKPKIVIEVSFEEIQKSPTYSSGYALRFPRLVQLREDKPPSECSDLDYVEDLFYSQRGK